MISRKMVIYFLSQIWKTKGNQNGRNEYYEATKKQFEKRLAVVGTGHAAVIMVVFLLVKTIKWNRYRIFKVQSV